MAKWKVTFDDQTSVVIEGEDWTMDDNGNYITIENGDGDSIAMVPFADIRHLVKEG